MLLPLAAEPAAKTSAPDPAPLLEELATLRRQNAALRAQVDVCPGGGGRADQQRIGADIATGGTVAQGQLRLG